MKSIVKPLALLPFVALSNCAPITGAFEGSTETFENTTEASVDVTSSTSPRSKSDSAALQRRERAVKFASANYDKIRRDIAQGDGEYARALGDLLVSEENASDFVRKAHLNYHDLFRTDTGDMTVAQADVLVTRLEKLT